MTHSKATLVLIVLSACGSEPVTRDRSISPLGTMTLSTVAAWAASCPIAVTVYRYKDRVESIECVETENVTGWMIGGHYDGYIDTLLVYAPDRSVVETRARGLLRAHVAPNAVKPFEQSLASTRQGEISGFTPTTVFRRYWAGFDDTSVVAWVSPNPQ